MPDRNRGNGLKFVNAIFGTIFVIFAIFAIFQIGSQHGASQAEQEIRSGDHEAAARQQIREKCLLIVSIEEKVDCIHAAEKSASKNDREEKDLKAQKDMAFWAFTMAIIGSFQAVISAAGIYYVAKNLTQTGKAVSLTSRQLVVENRPWIKIEPRVISDLRFDERGGHVTVNVAFINVGKSPAFRIRLFCGEIVETADDDVVKLTKRFIEKAREGYLAGEPRGETAFPNDLTGAQGSVRIKPSTVAEAIAIHAMPGVKSFSAMLIFSVVYQSAIDDSLFQTTVVTMMMEKSKDHIMRGLFIEDSATPSPVPLSWIDLVPYPSSYEAT